MLLGIRMCQCFNILGLRRSLCFRCSGCVRNAGVCNAISFWLIVSLSAWMLWASRVGILWVFGCSGCLGVMAVTDVWVLRVFGCYRCLGVMGV